MQLFLLRELNFFSSTLACHSCCDLEKIILSNLLRNPKRKKNISNYLNNKRTWRNHETGTSLSCVLREIVSCFQCMDDFVDFLTCKKWNHPKEVWLHSHEGSLRSGSFPTVPPLMSSYGFLSISPRPVLVAREAGPCEKWKEDFPAEKKSWIWISLGSGELLFCIPLIIFPLRACLCLHIFPPSIVLKETELMRNLLSKSLHILPLFFSSCSVGTAPLPYLSHAHF